MNRLQEYDLYIIKFTAGIPPTVNVHSNIGVYTTENNISVQPVSLNLFHDIEMLLFDHF